MRTMNTLPMARTTSIDRATTMIFAAKAGIDPRTAARILAEGLTAVRGFDLRERAARAAREMGIELSAGEASAA